MRHYKSVMTQVQYSRRQTATFAKAQCTLPFPDSCQTYEAKHVNDTMIQKKQWKQICFKSQNIKKKILQSHQKIYFVAQYSEQPSK